MRREIFTRDPGRLGWERSRVAVRLAHRHRAAWRRFRRRRWRGRRARASAIRQGRRHRRTADGIDRVRRGRGTDIWSLGMIGSRAWVGRTWRGSNSVSCAMPRAKLFRGRPAIWRGHRIGLPKIGFIPNNISDSSKSTSSKARRCGGMTSGSRSFAAIAGRRQYRVQVCGEANHAGRDADESATRCAVRGGGNLAGAREGWLPEISPDAVATVGRLVNYPNAVNVIADRVEFTVDLASARG